MVTSLFAPYALGAAEGLVWRSDLARAGPGHMGALQRPPGIIVVDSGAFLRGVEHWTVYMQEVLQAVYDRTGLRCMLVTRGNLAFL